MLTRTVEYVDNRHTGDPEQLLADFADTISRTGAWIFRNASAGIVFCPEHAQLLAKAGSEAGRVDWSVVETELMARRGFPIRITGGGGNIGLAPVSAPSEPRSSYAMDPAAAEGRMPGPGEATGFAAHDVEEPREAPASLVGLSRDEFAPELRPLAERVRRGVTGLY